MADVSKAPSKGKVDNSSIVSLGKGDDFDSYDFKEGKSATMRMADIYKQDKGTDFRRSESSGAKVSVKGGSKRSSKASSKKAAAKKPAAGKVAESTEKIMKFTPAKEKTPAKGKSSSAAKKSVAGGKGKTPTMPSPGGKKSTRTTDLVTMQQFKKYLTYHEKKKGGKVLGKRSAAGKASAASGKASAAKGKKSTK